MTVATTMEQPTASAATSAPIPPTTATTSAFLSLRDALLKRFGVHGAVDAFEHLAGLEERPVFVSVVRHEILQKFFGGMSAANPAIVRAYLDAKRGMRQPFVPSAEGNLGALPVKLTSDVLYFAHTAGALYRVPERISPEDLLRAMRRVLGDGDGGVGNTTVEDVRAFIAEWDSANFLHKDTGMHVLDFSLFLRFAQAEEDAKEAANDLCQAAGGAANAAVDKAKLKVRRQARATIALKRKQATEEGRNIARQREGELLIDILREELAVYQVRGYRSDADEPPAVVVVTRRRRSTARPSKAV